MSTVRTNPATKEISISDFSEIYMCQRATSAAANVSPKATNMHEWVLLPQTMVISLLALTTHDGHVP